MSFSLVPAALWPSVPKLVDGRYLGSGYSVIFWIQNLGLWAFPLIIGKTLQATNPGVSEQIQAGVEAVTSNYTVPMRYLASVAGSGLSSSVCGSNGASCRITTVWNCRSSKSKETVHTTARGNVIRFPSLCIYVRAGCPIRSGHGP